MIELGSKVRDVVSGLVGVATGRSEYLYGRPSVLVDPQETREGKPVEGTWIDEARLEVMGEGVRAPQDERRVGFVAGVVP